jgi:hypothetical protein
MTDPTPEDPTLEHPAAGGRDVLHPERDAEEIADEELPLDPAGPTELGAAVDG